jgi:predicted RNA binding protein YcfA (HicA-like mRNA interferase family)
VLKAGWYFVRHGSKHDLYGHDNHPGILIPIPRHESKEVPTGTANNILKIGWCHKMIVIKSEVF